jgi:hypothetical protein
MMMGKSMPPKGMPPEMSDEDESMDGENSDDKGSMGSKLLAMQNILDNLGDIVGDDMKPYIEQAKQSMQQHGQSEDDGQNPEMDDDGAPKSGLDVSIGLGGKPPMSDDSDEDEEGLPKKGFLAILSKKMKK